MDSGMIGKVEKAKRYAEEPYRFHFEAFTIRIEGENNNHLVKFENGKWTCDCDFFKTREYCSHTMGIEEVFKKVGLPLPE